MTSREIRTRINRSCHVHGLQAYLFCPVDLFVSVVLDDRLWLPVEGKIKERIG